MLQVAGGVAAIQAVKIVVGQLFHHLGVDVALALLGHYLRDFALLGFEVVVNLARRVGARLVFKQRLVGHLVLHRVAAAHGLHRAGAVVDGDERGLEAHLAVVHRGLAVELGDFARHVKLNRVLGGVVHRGFDLAAAAQNNQVERVAGAAAGVGEQTGAVGREAGRRLARHARHARLAGVLHAGRRRALGGVAVVVEVAHRLGRHRARAPPVGGGRVGGGGGGSGLGQGRGQAGQQPQQQPGRQPPAATAKNTRKQRVEEKQVT